MMAAPEISYTCEICGADGLTDDGMREHIKLYHLRDAISCPFCDLGDVSAQEMLTHVNIAHLDYLTPDAERLAFIDDAASDIALRPPSTADPPIWALLSPKSQRLRLNNNNNNNNNNSYYEVKPNGGAGCSDWVSSSQRSQLALNLGGATVAEVVGGERGVLTCPMCLYRDDSADRLAEHINRRHFDLTSPSFPSLTTPPTPTPDGANLFSCPLCVQTFPESRDLELHVNIEHKDILSPAKPNQLTEQPSNSSESCPVCCMTKFKDTEDLASHIDDHFNQKGQIPITPDMSCDRLLAKEMEKQDKEMQRLREQHEFEQLRAQYGMDNEGNFKEQSMTNMQRAVYSGELSVADYYERQVELRMAEHCGVDDGSSCTKDLVAALITISSSGANVARTFMCTTVDHYASTYGDKGWGCGYRNMQMMLSSLLQHTGYNERLYRLWGISAETTCPMPSRSAMPSISRLQHHIEWAWRQCFDPQGCDQLGGKLVNTRKWIGATEVVTVFSSLHIRCQLMDFHRPTCPNGSHPELFNWILEYFQANDDFKPPLYLQHQGHSRTIVGVEQLKDGTLLLLVFDPSHSPQQMTEFKSTATCLSAMRLVRKSLAAMKARQYQVVAVCGLMDSEHEFQQSKQLKSVRVPPER